MSEKTITLRTPIKINGVETSTITMREPTFDDNAALEKITSPVAKERAMFCNLCGLTPEEVGKLTLHDVNQIGKAFDDFL